VVGVAQALGRPVVVEAQPVLARDWWRLDGGFAVPGEEVLAEGAAVGEHPGVELDLVQDVAVVVDRASAVALAGVDGAGVLQEPVAVFAEVVGPGLGAAARDRPEAVEMAGAEELEQPPIGGLNGAVRPPQFAQLWRGEELVAPAVVHDRDVARLHRAGQDVRAPGVLDGGAVVAMRLQVAIRQQATEALWVSPTPSGPSATRGANATRPEKDFTEKRSRRAVPAVSGGHRGRSVPPELQQVVRCGDQAPF
jgi:hypothetical protein